MINFKVQMTKIRDTGCKSLSCIVHRVSCIRSHHASRITRHAGFTLVELLITMAVFTFVIAAATSLFVPLLTQFKQQSKMAETNIEGVVGLDIMRRDIEHAGYGLPWTYSGTLPGTYQEATSTPAISYNDTASSPPKAILSGNNTGTNSSDYLVIKAVNVANNTASTKWTNLGYASPYVRTWVPTSENLASGDNVIVISPGTTTTNPRTLIVSTNFYTTYNNVTNTPWRPLVNTDTRVVYGVDPNTTLKIPFNRADYYISTPTTNFPSRCAAGTGVLYKGTVNHADGKLTELPLLDCVADMQVVYCLDDDNDGDCEVGVAGSTDSYSEDISTQNAQWIRERVKQVRVYILAHEGQKDSTYTYPTNPLTVGEFGLGSSFNFTTAGITDWQNYRWKIYTIVVKPMDLYK